MIRLGYDSSTLGKNDYLRPLFETIYTEDNGLTKNLSGYLWKTARELSIEINIKFFQSCCLF